MCLSTKEIGKDLPFPFPENTGKIIRVRKKRGYDGGQVGASCSRWRSDHDEVCCPSSPNQFLKISLHCQVPDSITSSSAALWPVSQAQLSSSLAFKLKSDVTMRIPGLSFLRGYCCFREKDLSQSHPVLGVNLCHPLCQWQVCGGGTFERCLVGGKRCKCKIHNNFKETV